MKNALILHGTANNSQGNWFPWLKQELEKRGWRVWSPDLPSADKPNMKRYIDFLLKNDWQFNEDSVIIGHSSGAVTILGLLARLPDENKVNICILVGAHRDSLGRENVKGLFEEPFDFDKIKRKARKFVLIHSDNDPYVPLSQAQYLADKLGGELIVKSGQGHFNLEQGPEYKQFPLVLSLLEQDVAGEGLFPDKG